MRILKVFAAATILLSATPVSAAEGVGEALAVIEAARASGQEGERTLAVGSRVFLGDLVATDAIGEAQLLFNDGTRMVVGSNSSLVIDEFLFRGDAVENKFAVRALGGAFRFISGETGDQGYSIKTPTGTIGVRGTVFDFTVSASGDTKIVLLEGAATLCSETGDCETIATPCGLLQTDERKDVEEIKIGSERREVTSSAFPYVRSQATMLKEFQYDAARCTDSDAERTPPDREERAEVDRDPPEPDAPGDSSSDADTDGASGTSGGGSSSEAGPGGASSER